MLQCLMVAIRPLRVEEFAELLAFEFKGQGAVPKYRMDWRPNDQVEAVLSTCSSLISIVDDRDFQIVQFSHFSVKEFLMSNRLTSSLGDYSQYQILPRPAHTILAQACLGCLLHLDGHVDKDIIKGFPLVEYAAKHWVTHAQFEDVVSRVKDGLVTLFDCEKPHFAAWVGIYNIDDEASSPVSSSKIPTPLYYSSLCGFSDVVEHLAIKNPQHINALGGKYNFPLLAALVGKHIRVAEILLEHGANVDIRGPNERTPLHEAIPNVGIVQSLLNKGSDVNCRQDDLRTPLHLAAYYGEPKVARVLVDHKADVGSQDNQGRTPLYLLLQGTGRYDDDIVDLARLLLEQTTDVNIRTTDDSEDTPLHVATFWGRLEIVRMLLDRGTNPKTENKGSETPLRLGSRSNDNSRERGASIERLLLGRGVDVNASAKNLMTPLHLAAFRGRVEVAQMLLDYGANAKLENDRGETVLHMVSRGEYDSQEQGVSTAQLLLEHGVDVNACRKDGRTSLHCAAFKGNVEVAQVLLDHGANVKHEADCGETALHMVSRVEYNSQEQGPSTARLFLEHHADVNARMKDGVTSLHCAAFKGNVEVARVLLHHGANAKLETEIGETALLLVSRGEYNSQEQGVSTAQLLLEHGVEANVQRKDGWTPLHWAAFNGRVEVTRILLDHGADAKTGTDGGETALHIVSLGKYDSEEYGVGIARLLLEHGADVNARQKECQTSLHCAAFRGRAEVAQVLLDHGANVELETDRGETALHIVSRGQYNSQEQGANTARLLLERGVDVNAQRIDGYTSLHCAAFRGKVEVARVLLDHGANVELETGGGETALHMVSRSEYNSQEHSLGIAWLLLEHRADVNGRTSARKYKFTPLHSAAFNGRLDIAQVLLDHGADANLEAEGGETALHTLSRGEYDSQEQGAGIARLLLERGVDVNARKRSSFTSLHEAAFGGKVEVVRVLLDHGANVKLETDGGETALHIVSLGMYDPEERGVDVARLLLEHCVDVHAQNKYLNTALHLAAFKGRAEVTRLLLSHGANPNMGNYENLTPLHQASGGNNDLQEQDDSIARLLLEHGADVSAQDKNKSTPLHFAASKGNLQVARVHLFFFYWKVYLYSLTTGAFRSWR